METTTNYTPPIRLADNEERAKNTIITFWVLIGIGLIALISGYLELELLEKISAGGNYTDEQLESNDLRQGVIGIAQVITTIILAFLFIMWFRRGYVNAGRVSDRKLKYDDSWALWGFVVPIISLWYPYTIATEINDKMDRFLKLNKAKYLPTAIGWTIGLWWTFYIIKNVIGRLVFKFALKDETIDDFINGTQITLVSDFFDILAALVTVMMIMKMSEKEKEVKDAVLQLNANNALISSNRALLEEE